MKKGQKLEEFCDIAWRVAERLRRESGGGAAGGAAGDAAGGAAGDARPSSLAAAGGMAADEDKELAKKRAKREERIATLDKVVHVLRCWGNWESFQQANCKIQIKPQQWAAEAEPLRAAAADAKAAADEGGAGGGGCATEVLLIVKWGGDLTELGKQQALRLGERFRQTVYPNPKGGILRLHSTFRHDLKIRTSDEGRVMKTAAAFTKGLLELEARSLGAGENARVRACCSRTAAARAPLLDKRARSTRSSPPPAAAACRALRVS